MARSLRSQLNDDGYAVIEGLLSDEEINCLKAEAGKLLADMPKKENRAIFSTTEFEQNKDAYFVDSADKISYFFESGALDKEGELVVDTKIALNKIGHALHELNPEFRKITFDERIKETCFQLGLVHPAVVQSMYIFKNPGVGSEVTPHQDATFLNTDPTNLIGFWIALDDATVENGCLWFSRGSHKGGVHRRYIRNPDKSSDQLLIYNSPLPYYQKNNFTAVPVKRGTLVVIHGQVVHYSEPNKSTESRHAYTFHVVDQNNTKYSEENWLQLPEGKTFLLLYKN